VKNVRYKISCLGNHWALERADRRVGGCEMGAPPPESA